MSFPVIDAHQHVWDPALAEYDWLGPEMPEINRAIGFEELVPQLSSAGVDFTVLVESADNAEDTQLMIDTAARRPRLSSTSSRSCRATSSSCRSSPSGTRTFAS